MSKILIIGPLDATGYGRAAQSYILSLDSIGVDVVCRHVQMTVKYAPISPRIEELSKKPLDNIDTVIQYNLPSELSFKSGVKNIASFCYETDRLPPNSDWKAQLSLMGKIIVPCNWQKEVMPDDLKDRTYVVPLALDIDKYDRAYPKLEFNLAKSTYKFYTISEMSDRKNLSALLASYYSQFDANDDVVLIVKTHLPGKNPQETSQRFKELSDNIKRSCNRFLNLDRYAKVILISNFLTDDQINSLHQSCDCFVTTSHCESFMFPAYDSLGFGNDLIAGKHTSFLDIKAPIALVPSVKTPCVGIRDSIFGLYSSGENYFNPNVGEFGKAMSHSMENRDITRSSDYKIALNRYIKENFNYQKIGNQLKESIYD